MSESQVTLDVFHNGAGFCAASVFCVEQFINPIGTVQGQGAFRQEFVDQLGRGLAS